MPFILPRKVPPSINTTAHSRPNLGSYLRSYLRLCSKSQASKSSVTHLRAAALWKRLIYRRCDPERSSGPAIPINHRFAICRVFERKAVLYDETGKK